MNQSHVYDALSDEDLGSAADNAHRAIKAFNVAKSPEAPPDEAAFSIPPKPALIGIDAAVYRQIETALLAGKDHLMLYGPPGTGKTELARYIAEIIAEEYVLVTGSADWSSQDLIGGYQPIGNGDIAFIPGVLLRNFDKPFIIDELNRCDIDKVLGPLFTVLSRKETTLPYRAIVSDPKSAQYRVLGEYQKDRLETDFAPAPTWRIIATINTVDKASLYQMSYALSRRFAWVFVDVPNDLPNFVNRFVQGRTKHQQTANADPVLARIWRAVNSVRPLGAAPFIDMISYCLASVETFDFGIPAGGGNSPSLAYLDAFKVFVMPMLDGCLQDQLEGLADVVSEAIESPEPDRSRFAKQMLSIGL